MTDVITRFVNRLEKIGIQVTLAGNVPWIYLETVNGVRVTERFQANHGFTVFFYPVRNNRKIKFSDIKEVFRKIRQIKELGHDPVPNDYINYN